MANEIGLRAGIAGTMSVEPVPKRQLDPLVFGRQLRVVEQRVSEPKIVSPLAACELYEVQVMGALGALLEYGVVFELCPTGVLVTEGGQRQYALRNDGMRRYRHSDIEYRFRFEARNRSAPDVLHFERKLPKRTADVGSLDDEQRRPQRRVFAQTNRARLQTENVFIGAPIQDWRLIHAV